MKKIKLMIILLFLVSCSSNYVVRVETPSQWYNREKKESNAKKEVVELEKNKEEKREKENENTIVNISNTNPYNTKEDDFAKAIEESEKQVIEKNIVKAVEKEPELDYGILTKNEITNIENNKLSEKGNNNTEIITDHNHNHDHNINLHPSSDIVVDNGVSNNTENIDKKLINNNQLNELTNKYNYTEAEEKLLVYISTLVREKRDEIDFLLNAKYPQVQDKVTREQFVALCAKYLRNKKVNNFSYIIDRVIDQIKG